MTGRVGPCESMRRPAIPASTMGGRAKAVQLMLMSQVVAPRSLRYRAQTDS
ncbi:hypothetical protein D3C87_1957470 [compost metagenome]